MDEITSPNIRNDSSKTLYSIDYKDFYCSKIDNLAETRYVFQQGNQLPFRWKNKQIFTIAETGFGTGLNFLSTWREWQEDSDKCTQLHYISIEKHPIPARILCDLLAAQPELKTYADALITNYPPLLSGFHRLNLANGRIRLTLCFMDVANALNELSAVVDCWFLDGFAPAKNPDMWSQEVMKKLGGLSKPKATLATYTAASAVRRNMQAAGWQVEKRPGFGGKREMLTALWSGNQKKQYTPRHQPWYALPQTIKPEDERTATVIGGGIAGCQVARALAERNWHVYLIERHPQLAQEASGNPAGIIGTKMTAKASWGERFYRQAFLYTLRQLAHLKSMGHDIQWHACGNLQLNHSNREQQRWQSLQERSLPDDFIQFPDAETASVLAGIDLNFGGSFFPQAGWINPSSFCRALAQHPNIEVLLETQALSISHNNQGYQVNSTTGALPTSKLTIIANGRDSAHLLTGNYLPLSPVKGQTSTAAGTDQTSQLKTTIGHEGYLTPAINGQHIFGATFDRDDAEPITCEAADQTNWQQLQKYLPDFAAELHQPESAHAAIRMTTPDRYPYIGPVPDDAFYRQNYADLHYGKMHKDYPVAAYESGLFLATGFGSRGLSTSALCAELLAGLINGEPLPVERSLYYQLHPARFLVKKLKQKPNKPD